MEANFPPEPVILRAILNQIARGPARVLREFVPVGNKADVPFSMTAKQEGGPAFRDGERLAVPGREIDDKATDPLPAARLNISLDLLEFVA